jgi:hypothetical protein
MHVPLIESPFVCWGGPDPVVPAPKKTARAGVPPLVEDEVGAVAHVYREIARRIASNAFTRHASTLGDALHRTPLLFRLAGIGRIADLHGEAARRAR